jgi:hypothetical protein
MGQTLGQLKTVTGRSNEIVRDRSSNGSGYDSRSTIEVYSDHEDTSSDEVLTINSEGTMAPLEELADEFMKQHAFSQVANRYGIPDEYLSQDVPMEVCIRVIVDSLSCQRSPV